MAVQRTINIGHCAVWDIIPGYGAMSLSFGMLVIVVSGIIDRFDNNHVDAIFWLGVLFSVFLLLIIFLLIIIISHKKKEIKEL